MDRPLSPEVAPGPRPGPGAATARGRAAAALSAGLLLWPLVLAVPVVVLVATTLRRLLGAARENPLQLLSLLLACGLFAVPFILLFIARRWRPAVSNRLMAAGTVAAALILAIASHALVPLVLLALLLACARELGQPMAGLAARSDATPAEARAFGFGLGASLLSLVGLSLGLTGLLAAEAAWVLVAAAIGSFLLRRRGRLRPAHGWLGAWRDGFRVEGPAPPLLEQGCLALSLASLLIAFTLAVAPEVQSDAVRMHLALARRLAETGQVAMPEQWSISAWPLLAQVLYALGLLAGDSIAAKLWHTAAAAGLVVASGLLGRRLGGRTAGAIAAALVATLPIVGWLLGTAYVDLFAAFFCMLGALGLVGWQQTGRMSWAVLAGAAIGSAVAAKLTAGFILAGVLVAVTAFGGRTGGLAERLRGLAGLAFGAGLALGPWLARSFVLTATVPGVSLLRDGLLRGKGPPPLSLANLPGFGTGRDAESLLRLPWDLTFHTGLFGEHTDGFAGVTLLLLAPLSLLLPRTRAVATLAGTTFVAAMLWFFTAQYLRYLLPVVALAAVLAAAGLARLLAGGTAGSPSHTTMVRRVYVALLTASLACAPLFYLSTVFFVFPGSLPAWMLLGRESPQEYLANRVVSYRVLHRLDRLVPPRTPVVMLPDGPQLYSNTRLISNMTGGMWVLTAASADELAGRFAERGVRHLVLQPGAVPPSWLGYVVFQPAFLDRHARLLYATHGAALYEVGPGIATAAGSSSTRHQNNSLSTMPQAGSSSRE